MIANRRSPSLLIIGLGVALTVCLVTAAVVTLTNGAGSRATQTPPQSDPIVSVVVVDGSLQCEPWTDDSLMVSGRVQNTGTVAVSSVEVILVALDGTAEVSRSRTYADDGQLERGQISGFSGYVTTSGAIADGCRVIIGDIR